MIAATILAASACNQTANQSPNSESPANITRSEARPPIPPRRTSRDARAPSGEPKGPIDPKSVEAAGQVVQHYGALIEKHRWNEAESLWGSANAAVQFDRQIRGDIAVHLQIGDSGQPEGAAGSIFVTMPVAFTSTGGRGGPVRKAAEVTLRRVNDVPGSTEAQRRWHIERIDWKDAN